LMHPLASALENAATEMVAATAAIRTVFMLILQ
jgi:hypothetical protein